MEVWIIWRVRNKQWIRDRKDEELEIVMGQDCPCSSAATSGASRVHVIRLGCTGESSLNSCVPKPLHYLEAFYCAALHNGLID